MRAPGSRYLAAGALVVVAAGGPALLAPFPSEGSDEVAAEVALTFRDGAVDESSGLVVERDVVHTVNDSGDGSFVYTVDRGTGETTGVTVFADEDPVDVEALAPGRGGTVWVADIGDNLRVRSSVEVHRLRPVPGGGRASASSYRLRYPDGPHDAEALLVHPRTGRVLLVTKRPFVGGVVYRAPARMRPGQVHRMVRVAAVRGMVTDGAFLPGGRRLVLRTYGAATVYRYPGFGEVVTFGLPEQEQGEAVAVGPDGRIYLSTEGEHTDVLVTDLPELPTRSDPPGPGPTAGGSGAADGAGSGLRRPAGYAAAVLAAAAVAGTAVRASRRRGRRRR